MDPRQKRQKSSLCVLYQGPVSKQKALGTRSGQQFHPTKMYYKANGRFPLLNYSLVQFGMRSLEVPIIHLPQQCSLPRAQHFSRSNVGIAHVYRAKRCQKSMLAKPNDNVDIQLSVMNPWKTKNCLCPEKPL